MPLITAHFTISLDGFMAGPGQTQAEPLGVGGGRQNPRRAGDP